MDEPRLRTVVFTAVSLGVLAGWPVLVRAYELPLLWGTLLGAGILLVVIWIWLRTVVITPTYGGWSW